MSTDEFHTVARWTVDAIERLGPDHGVPGACRGSGGPGALAWLATWLLEGPTGRFLDLGGGLGGPSAWLAEHHGVRPVLAEPMPGSASGAQRLFALDAVLADGAALPFGDARFAGAWCLGVVSTAPNPRALLTDAARVLRPDGRLGLVVYLSTGERPLDEPEGNHFPTRSELDRDLAAADLHRIASRSLGELPSASPRWDALSDAVTAEVAEHHSHDPVWQRGRADEDRVAQLLDDDRVVGVAVRVGRRQAGYGDA